MAVLAIWRAGGVAVPLSAAHTEPELAHILPTAAPVATLVTGGTIDNPRKSPRNVTVLAGPSKDGGPIQNGVSRKVGPGDVVIIPPNTAHGFSEITSDQIVYLVVRIDPHKVLPAGYGAK